MNKKQIELLGVFNGIPTDVKLYYANKFNKTFLSKTEMIAYDELTTKMVELSLIGRDEEVPHVKVGGFKRTIIKPDIMGGKSTIKSSESSGLQAGSSELYTGGKFIDGTQSIIDNHILTLKTGYLRTMEKMCAEVYLTGKLNLKNEQDPIDYNFKPIENLTVKEKDLNWFSLFFKLITKYQEENNTYPTTIEVSMSIFNKILDDPNFRDQIKTFTPGESGLGLSKQPTLNIAGYELRGLVDTLNTKGEKIDLEDLIIISDNTEFIKAYSVLSYMNDNGNFQQFHGEYFVDEVRKKDPDSISYILKSGFVPIVPLPNRIMRYKLKITK